jgi:hypothetical protein
MPTYDCNEHQFVENLRRIIDSKLQVVVNRIMTQRDDGKYGLSQLPDQEFKKYDALASRRHQRATVYAKVPFYDDLHKRLYMQEDILHSPKNPNRYHLSIPYISVEYRFTLWGETYRHEFDVLYQPQIRLERREIFTGRAEKRATLIHVLNFVPPPEHMWEIHLPPSTIVFDVRRLSRA